MKVKFLLLSLFIPAAIVGCSKDDSSKSYSCDVKVTLEKMYNAAGNKEAVSFANDDLVSTLFVSETGTAKASASPATPGSSSSTFKFDYSNVGTSGDLIASYPGTASVNYIGGMIVYNVPTEQTGAIVPIFIGKTHIDDLKSSSVKDLSLSPAYCTMYVSVPKSDFSLSKITVKGRSGVGVSGSVNVDPKTSKTKASQQSVTVKFATPLDCRTSDQNIPVMLAPVDLTDGYEIILTDTDGKDRSKVYTEHVALGAGAKISAEVLHTISSTELVFCGSQMVYRIDADLCKTDYKDGVIWSWDARDYASKLGIAEKTANHLDDCKPVNDNANVLLTSSYGWCALVSFETSNVLFYTNQVVNAHSAELLPNNRVVVACSTNDNGNKLMVFDLAKSNQIVTSTPLNSAHGVVWNESVQRLYAIGGQTLQVYKLKNWDTKTPELELEKSITTPKSGLHDISYVSSNTLCVAGNNAYLFNVTTEKFTQMQRFTSSTGIKSLNYNAETGAIWCTDSTIPEGTQTWSSQTIRYCTSKDQSGDTRTIKVPDMDMYKVRVINW